MQQQLCKQTSIMLSVLCACFVLMLFYIPPSLCQQCMCPCACSTTTTQQPIVPQTSDCIDLRADCPAIADPVVGRCQWDPWTKQQCPKSCKLCDSGGTTTTTAPTIGCVDFRADCPAIASAGHCVWDEWSRQQCPQSCGMCSGENTTTTTTPSPTVTSSTTQSPITTTGSGPSPTDATHCPTHVKHGTGPPSTCAPMIDPNKKPASELERWLTRSVFEDLFPKANLGWGPHQCSPYNYDAFVIAARYFPDFGTSHFQGNGYSAFDNRRRDVAAFFAHVIQETGENNAWLYNQGLSLDDAHACFYRGGFFNWFEGGPASGFLDPNNPGYQPEDGATCNAAGKYCADTSLLKYFYSCNLETSGAYFRGCYFGRGAIQISYNYNYGAFSNWLNEQGINVDLLTNPNLVITHRNPPLAILASLWFYMTPQPPKPAMHDIVLGNWEAGVTNTNAGYSGAIFGPTSLVINNECGGEDSAEPGGPGESRRIKAFKWFTAYFGTTAGPEATLSCGGMPVKLESIVQQLSYQPDWSTAWKAERCDCAPATYGGVIPYFQPGFYPQKFVDQNENNRQRCVQSIYDRPDLYGMSSSACLRVPLK